MAKKQSITGMNCINGLRDALWFTGAEEFMSLYDSLWVNA
jgi:hypothetical protein